MVIIVLILSWLSPAQAEDKFAESLHLAQMGMFNIMENDVEQVIDSDDHKWLETCGNIWVCDWLLSADDDDSEDDDEAETCNDEDDDNGESNKLFADQSADAVCWGSTWISQAVQRDTSGLTQWKNNFQFWCTCTAGPDGDIVSEDQPRLWPAEERVRSQDSWGAFIIIWFIC